jgi:hypothetical protein
MIEDYVKSIDADSKIYDTYKSNNYQVLTGETNLTDNVLLEADYAYRDDVGGGGDRVNPNSDIHNV